MQQLLEENFIQVSIPLVDEFRLKLQRTANNWKAILSAYSKRISRLGHRHLLGDAVKSSSAQ